MDVRHKKYILLTALSIIGIGMLSYTIHKENTLDTANINDPRITPIPTALAEPTKLLQADETDAVNQIEEKDNPQLIYHPLLENENKQIDTLFHEYYLAKASKDVDKIKSMLTDEQFAPTSTELELNNGYVEEYQNILCYVSSSDISDGKIVFVYYEIKYISIDTAIPSLDKFYILPAESNQYKIFSSEMDDNMKSYYQGINQQSDVKALIETVNEEAKKAVDKDENLKIYLDELLNRSS